MTTTAHNSHAQTGDAAIGGYSPVSYFEKGRAEIGSPRFAVEHRGKTYHLTSAEQVQTFQRNPEQYVPAHDGACAYGACKGKTFPVDPTSFKIVDGRLLLFLKNDKVDARALWEQEQGQQCSTRPGGSCAC